MNSEHWEKLVSTELKVLITNVPLLKLLKCLIMNISVYTENPSKLIIFEPVLKATDSEKIISTVIIYT